MSRKPKKGYFVRGQFVAEGSELDIQLKAELKGTPDASRTDLKRESDALQDLGKELLTLRSDLFDAVGLPDKLVEAIVEAKRITNFEGKRRQMQYVGKLMRKLDPEIVEAARTALEEQHKGSATEKLRLHLAEQLLRGSDLAVGEIAARVGYNSQSAFTAALSRHLGMTPRQLRRTR